MLAVTSAAAPAGPPPRLRPNVVVFISDDLGAADLGYRGSQIRTPNLDRLAVEGIQFDRFYVYPWCSPTRAAFLSGRTPPRYAYDVTKAGSPENLAERFSDAGYQTALIGKWHLGDSPEAHPNRHGFDHFYGMISGGIGYYSKEALGQPGTPYDWQRNGETVHDLEYSTTLIGREAERIIADRDPTRPLFLVVSFNAPHFPADFLPHVFDWYRQNTFCWLRGQLCRYMAQVDTMDAEIGRVLAALSTAGIHDDTLIVFFNDNGGGQNESSNAPFRGGKSTPFEGGIRVPAIIDGPGLQAGTSHQVTRVQDLWATLEAAAGLPRRAPPESKNLWPILKAGASRVREFLFFRNQTPPFAEPCDGCVPVTTIGGVFYGNEWKLVVRDNQAGSERELMLFDIERDPTESQDLADRHPELVNMLARRFDEWDASF